MKPQDLIVLIKLHLWDKGRWRIAPIAESVFLSLSETHSAIKRLEKASLFDSVHERPKRSEMEEFLVHGVRYCFPAELGSQTRGLPTAHSAPPLLDLIATKQEEIYVWPFAAGKVRGVSIKPLYKTAPQAAREDKRLYEFLALLDALRIGRAREKEIATDELIKRIRTVRNDD